MGAHVHKTIYGPLVDTALYIMLLLRGQIHYLGLTARCLFTGPKKVLISSPPQPPPASPCNDLPYKYKSKIAKAGLNGICLPMHLTD
jgi:hypothetical protein